MDKIYFLTPTGGRQGGLSLLGEYMGLQTYAGDATWVIVDDCDPASFLPASRFTIQPIRTAWRWAPGQNTQGKSLIAGLALIPPDAKLLVLEDDDLYLPGYVQTMIDALDDYDLVGESVSRYYNVRSGRYKEMRGSGKHASLMCTAMKGHAIEAFRNACVFAPKYIDMVLWRDFKGKKKLLESRNTVGIKGLPGRAGIGVGHKSHFGNLDDGTVLREWLGDYADNY